ncbi:MAG: hypothetical protein GIW95_06535 [Candidatus Eremiobacteraeota bacterium]|nr:hypothetical protein [Candidatus Eremiobacteraeota bacterium]
MDVRGDSIGLYTFSSAPLLAIEGHAVVTIGARTIVADFARYDLRANRLVASGHVGVRNGTRAFQADAYALDLESGQAIVLRLAPEPTSLAVVDDNIAAAQEQPPDLSTFRMVEVGGVKPFLRTRHASVSPNATVRLTPAYVPTGPGPELPLPSYLYTIAQTNFSQSALPAAIFDQPYPLSGTANSLLAGHLRYDSQNGATVAVDEHLVSSNTAYAVVSIIPLRGKRVDLNAFTQLTRGVTESLTATRLYGPFQTNFASSNLQWTSPSSRTTLVATQFGSSNRFDVTLSTLDHFVAPFFTYKLQVGYGYDHNPGALPFANAFRISTYGYVASPNFVLPLGIAASGKYEYSLAAYDFPHEVTNGTLTATMSRRVDRNLSFFGQVSFAQTANRYRDNSARLLGLPDPTLPFTTPDGTAYPGYFAYVGLNTYRTYLLQTTLRPRGGENSVQLSLTHTRDFPQFHGLGRPPLYATLAVTQRLGSTLRVDIARSYAFGWGGQYFSPQYSLSISP